MSDAAHPIADLGAYSLGAVGGEESQSIRRHLEQCPECRHHVDSFEGLAELLAAARLAATEPAGIADEVLSRLPSAPSPYRMRAETVLPGEIVAPQHHARSPHGPRPTSDVDALLAAAEAAARGRPNPSPRGDGFGSAPSVGAAATRAAEFPPAASAAAGIAATPTAPRRIASKNRPMPLVALAAVVAIVAVMLAWTMSQSAPKTPGVVMQAAPGLTATGRAWLAIGESGTQATLSLYGLAPGTYDVAVEGAASESNTGTSTAPTPRTPAGSFAVTRVGTTIISVHSAQTQGHLIVVPQGQTEGVPLLQIPLAGSTPGTPADGAGTDTTTN